MHCHRETDISCFIMSPTWLTRTYLTWGSLSSNVTCLNLEFGNIRYLSKACSLNISYPRIFERHYVWATPLSVSLAEAALQNPPNAPFAASPHRVYPVFHITNILLLVSLPCFKRTIIDLFAKHVHEIIMVPFCRLHVWCASFNVIVIISCTEPSERVLTSAEG